MRLLGDCRIVGVWVVGVGEGGDAEEDFLHALGVFGIQDLG